MPHFLKSACHQKLFLYIRPYKALGGPYKDFNALYGLIRLYGGQQHRAGAKEQGPAAGQ